MTTPRKTRVAVVFGGRSPEHGVSCVSAGSVISALDPDQFEVMPVGITREGQWVLADGDGLAIENRKLPEITASSGAAVVLPGDPTSRGLVVVDPTQGVSALGDVDVVFPVLHGAYGEDGTIQGLLEMAGIPYVGSNVFGSAAAMDKEFTKKLAAAEGIPVGPYVVLRAGQSLSTDDQERLGLPVFVKPARGGSSFGITRVSDWSELDSAIAAARDVDPKVLVEAAVIGREIECGVLEGEYGGASRRACWPKCESCPATSSTTSKPSTSTTLASSTSRPTCRPRSRRRSANSPAARSSHWTAPDWRASTSS